jgi:hypothetical protein
VADGDKAETGGRSVVLLVWQSQCSSGRRGDGAIDAGEDAAGVWECARCGRRYSMGPAESGVWRQSIVECGRFLIDLPKPAGYERSGGGQHASHLSLSGKAFRLLPHGRP